MGILNSIKSSKVGRSIVNKAEQLDIEKKMKSISNDINTASSVLNNKLSSTAKSVEAQKTAADLSVRFNEAGREARWADNRTKQAEEIAKNKPKAKSRAEEAINNVTDKQVSEYMAKNGISTPNSTINTVGSMASETINTGKKIYNDNKDLVKQMIKDNKGKLIAGGSIVGGGILAGNLLSNNNDKERR